MSKGGSRYGRRSNWFKIHCLIEQEQNEARRIAAAAATVGTHQNHSPTTPPPPRPSTWPIEFMNQTQFDPRIPYHLPGFGGGGKNASSKDDMMNFVDYKTSLSPTISSPESHNSDSSLEINDGRAIIHHNNNNKLSAASFYKTDAATAAAAAAVAATAAKDMPNPFISLDALASFHTIVQHNPQLLHSLYPHSTPPILFPPHLVYPKPFPPQHIVPLKQQKDVREKRLNLDAILMSQRSHSTTPVEDDVEQKRRDRDDVEQSDASPIDLTIKVPRGDDAANNNSSTPPAHRDPSDDDDEGHRDEEDDEDEHIDVESDVKHSPIRTATPLDLTTKV